MIEQYLPNKNENATVSKTQKNGTKQGLEWEEKTMIGRARIMARAWLLELICRICKSTPNAETIVGSIDINCSAT